MFIDARQLDDGKSIQARICIIGGGPAGITLAREFANKPFKVCLLESGGFEYDALTQSLYEGENSGIKYDPLNVCRLRYLGGTSNHWGGWTRPLDVIDFEKREWIPYSGWPFGYEELDPYYRRAESIVQLGEHRYDPAYWAAQPGEPAYIDDAPVKTSVFRFSPPTQFGRVYRDELERAGNLEVCLHANVTDIELASADGPVKRLHVATLEGKKFTVSADIFILATGGIENARLLLASNKSQTSGIGNQHDLVGRFFADHYGTVTGSFLLSKPGITLEFYKQHPVNVGPDRDPARIRAALTLDEQTQRSEQLANFGGLIYHKSTPYVFKPLLNGGNGSFWKYVGELASNIDNFIVDSFRSLFSKDVSPELFEMISIIEPTPNPESRVTLGEQTDALGMRRAKLNWLYSDNDRLMLSRLREKWPLQFGYAGLGRALLEEDESWPPDWVEYGRHHMGTTRMHNDPRQGVVDSNCRIHNVANLYVAGSSVFPTYGYAQPTFTIVALALRLAEHIGKKVSA